MVSQDRFYYITILVGVKFLHRTHHIGFHCEHKVFQTFQGHPLHRQLGLAVFDAVVFLVEQVFRETEVGHFDNVTTVYPGCTAL